MKKFGSHLIRPAVYKAFRRLIYGTTATLLADFFIKDPVRNIKSYGFALCAVLCALGAWLSYLKSDGIALPKKPDWHMPKRKKPVFFYADIADHLDDAPDVYDDLEEEDKGRCLMAADGALTVIFIVLSCIC